MKISHIVCVAEDNVIGNQGKMPWHLSADLKAFKAKTMGHIILMGRKTFESLGRPLPGRLNIIISRNPLFSVPEGTRCFKSIEEALEYCQTLKSQYPDEIFVIGGAEIYRQTLPRTERIYLTQIHKKYRGDAYYPKIDLGQFKLSSQSNNQEGDLAFSFLTYDRTLMPLN